MRDGDAFSPTLYAAYDHREAESRAEWCVEVGALLEAMDTGELCAALERGDVTPVTRVWREGLDGWTPIEDLPELAPR